MSNQIPNTSHPHKTSSPTRLALNPMPRHLSHILVDSTLSQLNHQPPTSTIDTTARVTTNFPSKLMHHTPAASLKPPSPYAVRIDCTLQYTVKSGLLSSPVHLLFY